MDLKIDVPKGYVIDLGTSNLYTGEITFKKITEKEQKQIIFGQSFYIAGDF